MAASIIDALVITLGLDTSDYDKKRDDVETGMKDARENASKTAKEMETQGKKAASFFSSIKTELLALAGVSLTVGGLTSFVKNATNDLMNLSVQSKALNMSAQALDGWSRAAQAAGSSAESVTGTMTNLRNAALAFKNGDGSSPLYKAMAMLNGDTGVTFNPDKDSTDVMMRKFSEALQKENNPDRAQYIGQMITGNDAALYQGLRSGELPSLATKYTNSSQISDQSLQASKEFTRAWTDLGQNFDNLKNELFTKLIPSIRELNNVMVEWSKNTDQMSGFWKTFKTDMFEITGIDLGKWSLGQDLKNLKDGLLEFGRSITHLGNALNAINEGNFSEAADEFKKAWYGTETGKPSGNDALPGVTKAAKEFSGGRTVISTYQEINDSLNKILPEWLGGSSAKSEPANSGGSTEASTSQEKIDPLNKISPEWPGGTSAQKQHQSNEKSYWDKTKELLSKIASNLVTPASAAEALPVIQGYQPNIPLNATAAKLGAKGKELLDMMSGEFGQLEAKYGLPTGLLRSVAATESGGNPDAKSKAGAEGLFQFMPATAKGMGLQGHDVNDPHKSAEAAAKYLSQLLSQTGGDLESALAAYNWGIGNVKKKGIENAPEETRNYVPKVLAGMRPGSGMAVDRNPPVTTPMDSTPQYNISNVTVTSPAQTVGKLATDIVSQANNRVRVLAFNSGQQ